MSLAPIDFIEFQQRMVERIASIPEVMGLMFAGSSANLARADRFSDHDFYLIVEDDAAERFRQDLFWLPDSDAILLRPRETAHGLKVLYKSGRLLEFAVFQDSELDSQIAPSDSRVVFDRGGVAERIERIKITSSAPVNLEAELHLFLSILHIGLGRYRRGEIVAANQHIKSYAVNHLLGILRFVQPVEDSTQDALNRYRRFEADYPGFARRLEEAMDSPADLAAGMLLDLAKQVIPQSLQAGFQQAKELLEKI